MEAGFVFVLAQWPASIGLKMMVSFIENTYKRDENIPVGT